MQIKYRKPRYEFDVPAPELVIWALLPEVYFLFINTSVNNLI